MHFAICTIGFAKKSAEEFFHLLQVAGVKKLIDIRENRGGQLSGFAKYPDIAFFLEHVAGIEYVYQPALAPTLEIRKAYRQSEDWSAYESSFLQLMRDRGIPEQLDPALFEGTVALLCAEADPEKCHRRLVADLLAQYWRPQGHTLEINHLCATKLPPKPKKRRAPNDGTSHQ